MGGDTDAEKVEILVIALDYRERRRSVWIDAEHSVTTRETMCGPGATRISQKRSGITLDNPDHPGMAWNNAGGSGILWNALERYGIIRSNVERRGGMMNDDEQ